MSLTEHRGAFSVLKVYSEEQFEAAEPVHRGLSWLKMIAIAIASIAFLLAIDIHFEYFATTLRMRGFFRDLLNVAEVFGNGFGVVLVMAIIATLDPVNRRWIPKVALCAFGGGMAANLIKMMVLRNRPRAVDLAHAHVFETFESLLPLTSAGSSGQSFPSAHCATAAGLAVCLTRLYPQGKTLFLVLTLGVGIQRMFSGAHFPSDVLVGTTLGYCVGYAALKYTERPTIKAASLPEETEQDENIFRKAA